MFNLNTELRKFNLKGFKNSEIIKAVIKVIIGLSSKA